MKYQPLEPTKSNILKAECRNGLYHPSMNQHGTDSVGYTCHHNAQGEYWFTNAITGQRVTLSFRGYAAALKSLRIAEKDAFVK